MIKEFQRENRFLSNFYPAYISNSDGIVFRTVEHYYQASKAVHECDFERIRTARSPSMAKRYGRLVEIRLGWENIKLQVMITGVGLKFMQNAELRDMLLATGTQYLQEGNRWGDTFWGFDLGLGVGQNKLGRILMALREYLGERYLHD